MGAAPGQVSSPASIERSGAQVWGVGTTTVRGVPDSGEYLRGLLDTFDSDRAEAEAFGT